MATAQNHEEQLRAERDRLRAENEQLRGQLAAASTARKPGTVTHEFALSEGERQELETYGVINIGGRQYTTEQVKAKLGERYKNVPIADAPAATRIEPTSAVELAGVRGIDYVYPSVAPGQIDPAVAGTPGINGPAARTGK